MLVRESLASPCLFTKKRVSTQCFRGTLARRVGPVHPSNDQPGNFTTCCTAHFHLEQSSHSASQR